MVKRFCISVLIFTAIAWLSSAQPCDHALLFNGTDSYIHCGPGNNLNIEGQLTVEAWVKVDQRLEKQFIVGNFDQNTYDGFYLAIQNQALNCAVRDSASGTKSFNIYQVPANVWTHVAFTYRTGGRFRGYINGNLRIDVQASTTRIGNNGANPLVIGGAPWQPDTFVTNGYIDEVRIYNFERSLSDIRADMRLTLNGTQSGLIGYWKMAEGAGSITADGSGNTMNGTLSGTVLPAWQAAEGPYGSGNARLTAPVSSGIVSFPGTALSMDFTQTCLDTFVVTRIDCYPNLLPTCCNNYSNTYWIVDRYGVLNTVNYDLSFSLPNGAVSASDELMPSNLQLLQRGGFSTDIWPTAVTATSATSSPATINFTNASLTGQLILATTGNSVLNDVANIDGGQQIFTVKPQGSTGYTLCLFQSFSQKVSITIYDVNGRPITTSEVPSNNQSFFIDSSNWSSGFYTVVLNVNNKIYTQKIVFNTTYR